LGFAPVSKAAWLADEIERLYARETLVAQSVAVWQAFTLKQLREGLLTDENVEDAQVKQLLGYNFAGNKTFGSLVASLAVAKFHRRDANPDENGRSLRFRGLAHLETVPFARRCSSCERRGAVVNARVADEGRPLCEPCARKRAFGQLAKRDACEAVKWWANEKFRWDPGRVRSWSGEFIDAHPEIGDVRAPDDLNEIGETSKPEGFIGVVYADGNNMGGLLEGLRTPINYREFAEEVYNATKDAVFDALARHRQNSSLYPFEILSIGGDDLFLIVPAHIALPIACDIAKMAEDRLRGHALFEQQESYKWEEVQRCTGASPSSQCKVSLSTGVVLADAHTPVFYLEELASQLLKTAKHRAKWLKREYGYHGGTVDFLSLKSVTMIGGTVEQFRAAALTSQDKRLRLYARPYTIAEMEAMLESIKLLKRANFPRTQLYRLRESLDTSRVQSTVDYLYFLSRDSEVQDQRKKIERLWTPDGGQPLMHPWRKQLENEHLWETIWYDLVELYDFVPEEEEDHADHHD
jgi:CRISPR-associated protein Cmr2